VAAKKRGLGRGLDALLSPHTTDLTSSQSDQLLQLPVDLIKRGAYQPRTDIDAEALEELANSIRAQGVVQPIVVRPVAASDQYEIIAGERRWRAAQIAGLHEIPALVRDANDQTAMCMALIENIQREDLNPLEEARALTRLLKEFEMTHDQAAEAVGRSRSTVSNILRLLELHPDVQKMLEMGKLEMGHARAILALAKEHQPEIAKKVSKQELSVRATEKLIRKLQAKGPKETPKAKQLDPNIRRLQDDLSEQLGAPVVIQHTASGKGTVQIRYNSTDELDGILSKFK
jgi:ParB family chromosome partitioning protein